MFFIIMYKFDEGLSHISHAAELIEERQLMFCKLWIKKLIDIKVRDHLQTFVVVVRG